MIEAWCPGVSECLGHPNDISVINEQSFGQASPDRTSRIGAQPPCSDADSMVVSPTISKSSGSGGRNKMSITCHRQYAGP